MNILYIHTHDTGRYIEPYGYAVPTPNLMKLAEDGTLFRQAYCAGPTCSPSRAAFLTGMVPHSCGMLGLAHRGFAIENYDKHMVRFLNSYDYETVLCGVQHEAEMDETIGYRKILHRTREEVAAEGKKPEDWDLENAQKASEYLLEKQEKPFFLSFGMFCTHRKFPEDNNVNSDYVMPPYPLADTLENRADMAGFLAAAKIADKCVGVVLEALKRSGKEDDTLVIFTTDHGIAFPKMKCNLYDTGIGVSLIVKYKGNGMKGRALDALVSHLDIFPTICELLGLQKPEWLQGYSFLSMLERGSDGIREEIFSEVTYHAAYEPMRCIRTNRYKFIRSFDSYDRPLLSNIDDGLSKSFLMEHGLGELKKESEMLFDLYHDPVERINLVGDEKYNEVYNKLSGRLSQWMKETQDPLLKGQAPLPKGARINPKESLSPIDTNIIHE